MRNILDSIIEYKKACIKKKSAIVLNAEKMQKRSFKKAISAIKTNIIAEVKKASPSKGIICSNFKPLDIAKAYEYNGASAISVLTDEKYFQGRLEYLKIIAENVSLPVLRKDFIIDPFQIAEADAAGADAVLLIAAILDKHTLAEFIDIAHSCHMDALVEVHDEDDLDKALHSGAEIIGINNRNLKTFHSDIGTSLRLLKTRPAAEKKLWVSESGINTPTDIIRLKNAGVNAFLIGESLMREPEPGRKLKEMLR